MARDLAQLRHEIYEIRGARIKKIIHTMTEVMRTGHDSEY